LNIYQGLSKITKSYHMLNTKQYVAMREEALQNDGLPVDIDNAPDLVAWDTTRYTDWQKYLWGGVGKTTDLEASLSGGDARTTFRVASGYHYQRDILTVSGGNYRGSLSLNLNHKSLNQRFNMSLTATYSYVSTNIIDISGNATIPPNAPPIFDSKGKLNFAGWSPLNGNFSFGVLLQPYVATTNLLNSNIVLGYELMKGLVLKTNIGYNNVQGNQKSIMPIASQDPQFNPKGRSTFGYNFVNNLIIEPQLEYNGFINKGKLNVLAGASTQRNTTNGVLTMGTGYTNDALLETISNAPNKQAYNYMGQYRYAAAFSRINYNWENKYILNLNARRDGSSHFGPGRQFGNFGSAGLAWVFSEESLVKNHAKLISFGKLRGSYGITGGDQISNYSYLSLWSFAGSGVYNGILPLLPTKHTDSLLHWQVNRKTEIALDLGFLNDRISLEAAWYRNRCNNQLVEFPTPIYTGFTSVTSNSPADVENTGWEFIVTSKIIDNKNFKWSVKFNIGFNRNKLLAYPNLSQSPYRDVFIIGQPLNIRKLLHYTGVDPQTGLYTFQDKNKDGQITLDYTGQNLDDRYIYNYGPKFDGGFTSNFNYKNFDLSALFYFKKQMGTNALASFDIAGGITNQPADVLQRWQKAGDVARIAKLTANPGDISYFQYLYASDATFTDASFIRLQNLSLSYTLPEKLIKKMGLNSFRIYLQQQNLFVITKYKGIDPEIQVFGGLPLSKITTVGISCNF